MCHARFQAHVIVAVPKSPILRRMIAEVDLWKMRRG
jgi:hypothetical protein